MTELEFDLRELDGYPKKVQVEKLYARNRDFSTRNYGTMLCDLVYLDSCHPKLGLWLGALFCDLMHYHDMLT